MLVSTSTALSMYFIVSLHNWLWFCCVRMSVGYGTYKLRYRLVYLLLVSTRCSEIWIWECSLNDVNIYSQDGVEHEVYWWFVYKLWVTIFLNTFLIYLLLLFLLVRLIFARGIIINLYLTISIQLWTNCSSSSLKYLHIPERFKDFSL